MRLSHFLLALFAGCLISCSGGSSGGSAPPSGSSAAGTTVSGSVQAPGGLIALQPKSPSQFFANFFSSAAYANISGSSAVPDGTVVQLGRVTGDGSGFSLLSSAQTAGGRYSFNLTNLNLQFASDLLVQVVSGTAQMRAFVVSDTVDLDPVSETAVQLALEQLSANPGSTLNNFTVQELADLTGSISVITTASFLTSSSTIDTTVTAIRNAALANGPLTAFLIAAASPGQTTDGPGDVGNHFPLSQSSFWDYTGTQSSTGQPAVTYTNRRTLNGTRVIGTTTTVVVVETNGLNAGSSSEEYFAKTNSALTNWGNNDPGDFLSAQVIPYPDLRFPLYPGAITSSIDKPGLTFQQDLDGDGKDEHASLKLLVKVIGYEDTTVPAGTYANTLRVEATISTLVTLSNTGATLTGTEVQTIWLASGVGIVRRRDVVTINEDTQTTVEELTGAIVDGRGAGSYVEVRRFPIIANDLVYNPAANVFYVSRPGNPGSVASVDPNTGSIIASLSVGSGQAFNAVGPSTLMISEDGQYLYAALNTESVIKRVNLQSFTVDGTLLLGPNVVQPQCILQVSDMRVLPGNSRALAVSKFTDSPPGISCGQNFYEVAIYDDAIQRPNTVRYPFPPSFNSVRLSMDRINFLTTAQKLYGFDTGTTAHGIFELAVNASGVTISNAASLPLSTFQKLVEPGGTRVYTSEGYIIDPATLTVVGGFSLFGNDPTHLVRPDPASGRVFFLNQNASSLGSPLWAYDMTTFERVGSTNIPISSSPAFLTSLVRWGANGLAFLSSGKEMFVIRTSLIP
jgi:hypothetical protein